MNKMKWSLILIATFVQFWTGNCGDENQCKFWDHVPVTLQDLNGTWYIVSYVNEANDAEKHSCSKFQIKYHPENGSATEYTTAIQTSTKELLIITAELQMPTPGILNQEFVQNNTKFQFHDYFVEFTRGESFITALCEKINGTKYTDRLAIFFRQQHVGKQQILSKLKSIGVLIGEENEYYRIPQEDCPN